jgi:hypothetical protein
MEYMNDLRGCNTSKDLGLGVTMGLYPGYSYITKYGVNLDVLVATDPEDMWEGGGLYTYDTWGTAPIMYMSSSSVADTGQTIRVIGLDINGYEVTQYPISTGQALVTLDTPLWRVYKMTNLSADGSDVDGILYVHTDAAPINGVPLVANARALINGHTNSTLMTIYTIPRGKVGFFMRGEVGVQLDGNNAAALAEFAHIHFNLRPHLKNFITQKSVTNIVGGAATYKDERIFPDPISALSDIKMTVEEVSADMGLWGSFEILLVDQTYFDEDYLEGINQPFADDE